jgi:hypothetical protein
MLLVRKRPLGSPKHIRVDTIKTDFGEIVSDGVDWIDLAHDRDRWRALVNSVLNVPVR